MAMPLGWTVDEADGYVVVSVGGVLGLNGCPALRTALLKCLAEQPDVLLVELSAMEMVEPTALSVFTSVIRQADRWPGTPVPLCAARPATRTLLDRGGFGPLTTHDSVADALLATERRGSSVRSSISDQLPPIAGAVRQARNLATEACSTWDLPHLVGPASLVVSELVSNAIEHAGTMMTVRFARRHRYLHVTVRDGSGDEPRLAPPTGPLRKGTGLVLVDNVATHWGWLPSRDGKVVWAVLATAA